MYIKYVHWVDFGWVLGISCPTPRLPLPLLLSLCCRGLSCMEYTSSAHEFCLLVGFGQCRLSSQEMRGREEESGSTRITSLFPSLLHLSIPQQWSLPFSKQSLLSTTLSLWIPRVLEVPLLLRDWGEVALGWLAPGPLLYPGSFLTLPTPL